MPFRTVKNLRSPTGASLATRYQPAEGHARAVLLIEHGLAEHSGRYLDFARFMARRGFHVHAHDHRGHGLTGGAGRPAGRVRRQGRRRCRARRLPCRARACRGRSSGSAGRRLRPLDGRAGRAQSRRDISRQGRRAGGVERQFRRRPRRVRGRGDPCRRADVPRLRRAEPHAAEADLRRLGQGRRRTAARLPTGCRAGRRSPTPISPTRSAASCRASPCGATSSR